jgi:hypothetical protein
MKLLSKFVFCAFFVIILASCATSYQRSGLTGGYSETKLGENIWNISFQGNGYTNDERANDFTLLRSAEVCLENGYSFFIITQNNGQNSVGGGRNFIVSSPSRNNTVVCFKEKPVEYTIYFDATFVYGSIRSKYGIGK